LLSLFLVVFHHTSEQGVDGDFDHLAFLVVFRRDVYAAVLDSDFHRGSLSAPLTWSQSHEIPDTPWLPAVMTQSTRRVSDSVTMHSLMRSSLDSSEHVVPVAAMAWAGVDVLDALPHPASAAQSTRVMAVRAAHMVFLIGFIPFRRWRGF
jgi:hypothetical protein